MSKHTDSAVGRLLRLALHLGAGKPVTTALIRERFGVSKATAKRDLDRLECLLPVTVEEVTGKTPYPQKVLRLDGDLRVCTA